MTIQDEQQLDSFHRKQLTETNIKHQMISDDQMIRNNKLYEKTNSKPVGIH